MLIYLKNIFRYFHSGLWAAENSRALALHPRMLVLCSPSQVCIIFHPIFKLIIIEYEKQNTLLVTGVKLDNMCTPLLLLPVNSEMLSV
jgi:hypothetical protein